MEKKKFGYYRQSKGVEQQPELIREFEAEKMDHNKDYVTFINWALSGNVNNASINGGFRSDDFSVRSAG